MKKTDKSFIRKLEGHIEKTEANMKYSIDRFDLLIISISSGGLVFSMGYVKDLMIGKTNIDYALLKISWVLFTISIVVNLLSQVSGYYANKYEIRISRNLIREVKNKPHLGNQTKYERNKRIANSLTNIFNGSSLLLLTAAIVLIVVFVSKTL